MDKEIIIKSILDHAATSNIKPNARGWLYILEVGGLISKDEFSKTALIINAARKNGELPLDIVAEDSTRQAYCAGYANSMSLEEQLKSALESIGLCSDSLLEEFTGRHIELSIEKVGMLTLFSSICNKYELTYYSSKGSADLNSRVSTLERLATAFKAGRPSIMLSAGDLDPSGLVITQNQNKLLTDMMPATLAKHLELHNLGVDNLLEPLLSLNDKWADAVKFYRIGLDDKFISKYNLPWIDGLTTSSGGDLASKEHRDHTKSYVQSYLKKYGPKKCELDVLYTLDHAITDKYVEDVILKIVKPEHLAAYDVALTAHQQKVQEFKNANL